MREIVPFQVLKLNVFKNCWSECCWNFCYPMKAAQPKCKDPPQWHLQTHKSDVGKDSRLYRVPTLLGKASRLYRVPTLHPMNFNPYFVTFKRQRHANNMHKRFFFLCGFQLFLFFQIMKLNVLKICWYECCWNFCYWMKAAKPRYKEAPGICRHTKLCS